MMKSIKFEGLIAAPFTPFDEQDNLNLDLVPLYYDFLKKNGVKGAFINGSTGEGVSLTHKERQQQTEKWAEALKNQGGVGVINLVGGTSYKECIEHAIISRDSGISAIAVLGPYYFKPADENYLADFVAKVGESVPGMPVYYYHIPVLTGVNIPMSKFLPVISAMLPNFAGIKYTHEDFMDFMTCLNYKGGSYGILWGRDENLLPSLSIGSKGAVGSTYNYAAPLYLALIKAFNEGRIDEAARLQQSAINMIGLLGKYGGMGTGKAFMKYVGLDCGKFRSPVRNLTADAYSEFERDVKALGIDDLFSIR